LFKTVLDNKARGVVMAVIIW